MNRQFLDNRISVPSVTLNIEGEGAASASGYDRMLLGLCCTSKSLRSFANLYAGYIFQYSLRTTR